MTPEPGLTPGGKQQTYCGCDKPLENGIGSHAGSNGQSEEYKGKIFGGTKGEGETTQNGSEDDTDDDAEKTAHGRVCEGNAESLGGLSCFCHGGAIKACANGLWLSRDTEQNGQNASAVYAAAINGAHENEGRHGAHIVHKGEHQHESRDIVEPGERGECQADEHAEKNKKKIIPLKYLFESYEPFLHERNLTVKL